MIPALILIASAITRFIHFGKPMSVVFDEVFYGNFVSNYWQGTYFFDLHPPFVKLLFAFVGKIIGASQYTADWSSIGNILPNAIVDLRIIPMLAGTLLPLIVYALCRKLNFSKLSATTAATFICLENSLIVQSRFLLPDAIMILAGFGAILLYLEYIQRSKTSSSRYNSLFFASSAVLAALALSTKWTGLTFLFLIFVMEKYRLYEIFKEKYPASTFMVMKSITKKMFGFSFYFLFISAFIYISLFAIHFYTLPFSGPGDVFMTRQFQKNLIGNQNATSTDVATEGFASKFLELNHTMFTASSGMTATHSYSSKWYSWPLEQRPVFYWQDTSTTTDSRHSYIYLLGNPFIYWLSAISIIFLIVLGAFVLFFKDLVVLGNPKKRKILFFLIIGYLVNLLPFIFIGRVMFLYHYEAALIFAIISIAFFIDLTAGRKKTVVAVVIIVIAFSAFLYWSPLTYGSPLSDSELAARMWLPSWR